MDKSGIGLDRIGIHVKTVKLRIDDYIVFD